MEIRMSWSMSQSAFLYIAATEKSKSKFIIMKGKGNDCGMNVKI